MLPVLEQLRLTDAASVIDVLRAGVAACEQCACRRAGVVHEGAGSSLEVIDANAPDSGTLIATGDLHDHPVHLARLLSLANLTGDGGASGGPPAHLTLHELIHSDRLVNGMDFSYRMLARAAALKSAFPEHVHVLLGNHEIAQLTGSPVVKDGVKCVEAFDEAVDYAFTAKADAVREALHAFLRALPLGLRVRTGRPEGDVLCAHSLPGPGLMDRFDPNVLTRGLNEEDFQPRRGSAYLMTWGREHTPEQIRGLGARWGVGMFILGHEHAADGFTRVSDECVVLNSDHDRGVCAVLPLTELAQASTTLPADRVLACLRPLGA